MVENNLYCHLCEQCLMQPANFHQELWRATYNGLEITESVSMVLYLVSATIVQLPLEAPSRYALAYYVNL